jgi:hypothetical protein
MNKSMKIQKVNWPIWVGLLLCVFALLSFEFVFVRWPTTRDFPWVNLLIFAIAGAFLLAGVRRGFTPERRRRSRIVSSLVATFGFLIIGFFIFAFFIGSRWLPPSHGAPQIGQKAPDFNLADTAGKTLHLSELLTEPIDGKAPRAVLLIFYRGYW